MHVPPIPPGLGAVLGREILKPQGEVRWPCGCTLYDLEGSLTLDACADFCTASEDGCAISGFLRGAAIRQKFDAGVLKP